MQSANPGPVKAFLLAAGLGSRLRPLTDHTPKCLVPIGGKPLLQYWVDDLAAAGVQSALVNTHWLHGQVEDFVRRQPPGPLQLRSFHEPTLLGSAGTLAANREWAADASAVLVIYADNFTRFNIAQLLAAHQADNVDVTLGVFKAADPRKCGIVEVDEQDRGLRFVEKPQEPRSDLAAAGLYVLSPAAMQDIASHWNPAAGVYDLGFDVFPRLVQRARVFRIQDELDDIGTLEAYRRVCAAVEARAGAR